MLRGAFGNALTWLGRRYSDERGAGNDTYLAIYDEIFKVSGQRKYKPHIGGVSYNPYFFECDRFEKRHFSPGEQLTFSTVFIGEFADRHIQKLITAVKLMVEGDICGCFDSFVLEAAVEDSNGLMYYKEGKYYDPAPEGWYWSDKENVPGSCSEIIVVFDENAPMHFTADLSNPGKKLSFKNFFEKVLQRIEVLCTDFSSGTQLIEDWDGLLERAEAISCDVPADTETPFLIQQNGRTKSGEGRFLASGEIRYAGNLTEFIPYIEACSVLHIGKGSSMDGSGHYTWRALR